MDKTKENIDEIIIPELVEVESVYIKENLIEDNEESYRECIEDITRQLTLFSTDIEQTKEPTMFVPVSVFNNLEKASGNYTQAQKAIQAYMHNENAYKQTILQYKQALEQSEIKRRELEEKYSGINARTKALLMSVCKKVITYNDDIYKGRRPYIPQELQNIILKESLPSEQSMKNKQTRTINNQNKGV